MERRGAKGECVVMRVESEVYGSEGGVYVGER